MPKKISPADDDWEQIHGRSFLYLAFENLYTVLVGGFWGLFCLGAVAVLAANLLTLAGLRLPSQLSYHLERDFQRESWGQNALAVVLLLAMGATLGAFAWGALKNVWGCLVDAFCPAVTYQGHVKSVQEEKRASRNSVFRYWVVNVGEKTWSIPQRGLKYVRGGKFETEMPGKEIRVRYLRGTEEVTRLWVKWN